LQPKIKIDQIDDQYFPQLNLRSVIKWCVHGATTAVRLLGKRPERRESIHAGSRLSDSSIAAVGAMA
jgi:hypothetical protein